MPGLPRSSCPTEIYFAPYADAEIREIMKARVMQGLFQNVLSDDLLDLVVEQTLKSGDLRVGIDLLKRATLSAERAARRSIEREDICGAYEISKYLHLNFTVKTLKDEERLILRALAERSTKEHEMNAGDVYKAIKENECDRVHAVLRDCQENGRHAPGQPPVP